MFNTLFIAADKIYFVDNIPTEFDFVYLVAMQIIYVHQNEYLRIYNIVYNINLTVETVCRIVANSLTFPL